MSSSSSSIARSTTRKRKDSSRVSRLPYLPDDLLLICLARVSRLYYPILSLVSKRFRSLLASDGLYQTRTLLNRTESCLYICLFSFTTGPHWLTLCRKPTRIPNPKSKPGLYTHNNLLVTVPTHNYNDYPLYEWEKLATIDSSIYMIGGYRNDVPSSRVFIMDCRSHTWCEAPSMRVARKKRQVSALDGKIYVVGGLEEYGFSDSMECFDPKTQTWEDVPIPVELRGDILYISLAIDGKLYFFGNKSLVYEPKENRWDAVESKIHNLGMCLGMDLFNFCVINNVVYCYSASEKLKWYDFKVRSLNALKGLEEVDRLPKTYGSVRLVNYGGKIAVLWAENVCTNGSEMKKNIWCAVITLEKRNDQEIYGNIEWCDIVLTVPGSYFFMRSIAANV